VLLTCVLCLFTGPAHAEEPTPLAGEEFHTEVLGEPVKVPPRDRKTVTAASAGIAYLPNGPSFYQVLPFGAFYVWRHSDDYKERFRGSFSVAVNDVAYNVGSHASNGWELRFTFNNMIIPLGRAEYVEGQIIRDVEVEWNYAFAGVGLAYRKWLAPGQQDNALEVSLTYEPGYRWFQRSKGTARGFIVPTDTYEGRLHARLRRDALERNIMELPHRGYAFGGDFLYGHRATWGRWGGVAPFESPNVEQERDYLMGSVYAIASSRRSMAGSGGISTGFRRSACRAARPAMSGKPLPCLSSRAWRSTNSFQPATPLPIWNIATKRCSFSIRMRALRGGWSNSCGSNPTAASADRWTRCPH
jgi:hypothetical protein